MSLSCCRRSSLLLACASLWSCVHTSPKSAPPPAPVAEAPKPEVIPPPPAPAVEQPPQPVAAVAPAEPAAPVVPEKPLPPPPPTSPDCRVVPGFPGDEPVYLQKSKVVLTRLSAPCMTPDGQKGHLPTGGWVAMGFPCTGGEGRIDWKGTNYNAPKMVSFLLDTSCAMAPTDQNRLKQLVIEEAGLPPTAPLIAFNPFGVQYWEVQGVEDADATFTVDLRSTKSLTSLWNQYIKLKPINVLLVGRENAWGTGNHMYAVTAELNWASKNRFTMKVVGAHTIRGEELTAIKTRCEALRPERECGKVF